MSTFNDPTTKLVNEKFWSALNSDNPSSVKRAEDTVNDYLRTKMREQGFFRKILPPIPVSNQDIDRSVDTDKPVIILDKEPNSPAAITMPFAKQPIATYIKAARWRIMFSRILTPKFVKDIEELRTYDMDVRQILSDNAIKDMLAEEDATLIATVNWLVGNVGSTVPETGVIQHRSIAGGISRESINDALKILPETPSNFETATGLINSITAKDFQKWGLDEVGGNLSEEILRNGFGERTMFNVRWIVTIKNRLVQTNNAYLFAEPKCLGRFFVLTDTTMHIKRENYMLEFFASETIGAGIGNVSAIARVQFA